MKNFLKRFFYENLSTNYFGCGCLGHRFSECSQAKSDTPSSEKAVGETRSLLVTDEVIDELFGLELVNQILRI